MIWPLRKPAQRMISCLRNPGKIPVVRERLSKKINFLPLLTSPYVTIGYQRNFQDEHSLLYAFLWEVIIFRVSLSLGLATTFTR
jgi:hypothetical protein